MENLEQNLDCLKRRKTNKFESQRVSPSLRHPFIPSEVLPFTKKAKGRLIGSLQSYNGKFKSSFMSAEDSEVSANLCMS